jgi:hypothetical protein
MLRKVVLVVGLTLSVPVNAQETLAFKCPSQGATMTTSVNSVLTFTRQEGLTCFFKRRDSDTESPWLGGVTSPTSNLATQFKTEIEKLWPVRVGTKTDQLQTGAGSAGRFGYVISFPERKQITVPAGTFDVVVIENLTEGLSGRNKYKSIFRYYYALDVGYHVKFEPILVQGSWPTSAPTPVPWEATKITRP